MPLKRTNSTAAELWAQQFREPSSKILLHFGPQVQIQLEHIWVCLKIGYIPNEIAI